MDNRMVRLKNMINAKVEIHEPAYGIHREFVSRGAIQLLPFDIVQQLLWTPGFRNMINQGILYIEDMQDKIDLQLEDPGTEEPTKIRVLNDTQKMTLLKVRSFDDFATEIEGLSIDQLRGLVDYAVENELLDTQKVNLLKELTGRDAVKIAARKREAAEVEAAEAEKANRRRTEGEFNSI